MEEVDIYGEYTPFEEGDERWLAIRGYEFHYHISDKGNVRNIRRWKYVKPRQCRDSYWQVSLHIREAPILYASPATR